MKSVHTLHAEVRECHAPPCASSPDAPAHCPSRHDLPWKIPYHHQRHHWSAVLWVALLIVLGLCLPAHVAAAIGDRVELKATHHAGVPLHREPRSTNDFQRVPDGTVATVAELAQEGRWLKLQLADGRTGWITARYVGRTLPPGPSDGLTGDERRVWNTPEECQQVVTAGGRMAPPAPQMLRVGTWNIRWFPKGCSPQETCPENATDLAWLACTIAWMNVDLLAVQEVLTTGAALQAMTMLRTTLNQLTGGQWQADFQTCGVASTQHVGFLWNSARVTLTSQADAWELNGAATETTHAACAANLRPGRYAYVEAPGGTDFHLLSVHFDSGRTNRDYQHRRQAAARLGSVTIGGALLEERDVDILVLGDYNTMGREEAPPISVTEELAAFDQQLSPGFRRLPMVPTPACTEYFDGQPGTLDHMVVSRGMQEAATTARVTGYCAVAQCTALAGSQPSAAVRLSDHCPVVMEIRNEDQDD